MEPLLGCRRWAHCFACGVHSLTEPPRQHYHPVDGEHTEAQEIQISYSGKEAGKFQSLSILNPISFPPCRAVSPCVKTCLITFNPSTSGVWSLDQGRLAEPEALGGLRRGPGAGFSSRPGCRNTKTSRFACLLFVLAEK